MVCDSCVTSMRALAASTRLIGYSQSDLRSGWLRRTAPDHRLWPKSSTAMSARLAAVSRTPLAT